MELFPVAPCSLGKRQSNSGFALVGCLFEFGPLAARESECYGALMRAPHPQSRPLWFVAMTLAATALLAGLMALASCSSKSSQSSSETPSTSGTPAPAASESSASAVTPPAATGAVDGATIFAQRGALCHRPTAPGDG